MFICIIYIYICICIHTYIYIYIYVGYCDLLGPHALHGPVHDHLPQLRLRRHHALRPGIICITTLLLLCYMTFMCIKCWALHYIYIYIYIYIHVCVYIYIYIYICTHTLL